MRKALLVGLLIIGLAGIGNAAWAAEATPFKGSSEGLTTPLAPSASCPLHFQSEGSGVATHLGRLHATGTTCGFNLRVVTDPPFDPGGQPPYMVGEFINEATWTAANGDELNTTTHGVFVQSLTDGSSGVRGTMTIHGGTGRFDGATGEALGHRDADEDAISISGWIDYDASNRSE